MKLQSHNILPYGKKHGLRRWDFGLIPVERSLETMRDVPGLHIIGSNKGVDMFA